MMVKCKTWCSSLIQAVEFDTVLFSKQKRAG